MGPGACVSPRRAPAGYPASGVRRARDTRRRIQVRQCHHHRRWFRRPSRSTPRRPSGFRQGGPAGSQLSGHGLQGVGVVTIRKDPATPGRSKMTPYFSASENSLGFTLIVDSAATPGTAYDLELSGTSTAGPVDIVVPAFLVVDQPPQTILDFAGADHHQANSRDRPVMDSCAPMRSDPGVQPCADYVVRLPGAGQLDTKLNWRVELMDDVIARAPSCRWTTRFKRSPVTCRHWSSCPAVKRVT